ncbi:MAG: tRNA lysidine(34) synthetase TilS [Deinococcaceae bacterium]
MSVILDSLGPYTNRRVLLALSGGSDSVGLLRGLLAVGADVRAAHFEHRNIVSKSGAVADDPTFVAQICAELGVPLAVQGADVPEIAAVRKWSLEEAGRRLRYSFLTRVAKAERIDVILTAHTLQDQAETVLLQLFRGTAKATGIPPKRGHIERPWLGVDKGDIQDYLRSLGQSWREDQTNLEDRQTRTWLRLHVLPEIRSRFPRADHALARYARFATQDEQVFERLFPMTPYTDWRSEPPAIQRRLIVQSLLHQKVPFDAQTVDQLAGFLHSPKAEHLLLKKPLTVQMGQLWWDVPDCPKPDFEYPERWMLRHREPGDTIALSGGRKKLKDVLIDKKIPRTWRDHLWVLAEGHDIKWVGIPKGYAVGSFGNIELKSRPGRWYPEMQRALGWARQAMLEGEVPVGAIVTAQDGTVVGEGYNRSRVLGDMTEHAELWAIREASRKIGPYLKGCTLVVSLEPCPMCYGAALEARIDRIVYGAVNPKMGALGGVVDLGRCAFGHKMDVVPRVCERESEALLKGFFGDLRSRSKL